LSAAFALAVTIFPRTVHASASARLVYSRTTEASSCPAEDALRAAIGARFGYAPFFAWAKQTVVVLISRPHGRYLAHLELLDERGIAHGTRDLSSDQPDCSEIFDAAALAISIALDVASKSDPQATATAEAEPPQAGASGPDTSAPAAPPDAAPVPSLAPAVREQSDAHPSAADRALGLGVDVVGSLGTTPSPAAGVSAFVRYRVSAWSLALEARADAPTSATRSVGGGVEAWLLAGALVPCFRHGFVAACAVGQAGSLQARGIEVSGPTSSTALFAAAGARVEVEWPLSTTFSLRARGDWVIDLNRVTLALGSDNVWRAPPSVAAIGVGMFVNFY
jgi:hypothetical protein